jgi:hypothetical protein
MTIIQFNDSEAIIFLVHGECQTNLNPLPEKTRTNKHEYADNMDWSSAK